MKKKIIRAMLVVVVLMSFFVYSSEAGVKRYLKIHNLTNENAEVQVGDEIGTVYAGTTFNWYVNDAAGDTTVFSASTASKLCWDGSVNSDILDYDWYLQTSNADKCK